MNGWKDNGYVVVGAKGHRDFLETIQGSATPKGFFMTARQYQTENTALLDSSKIENERLIR